MRVLITGFGTIGQLFSMARLCIYAQLASTMIMLDITLNNED